MPHLPTTGVDIKKFVLPTTEKLPVEEQVWVDLDVGNLLTKDILVINNVDENMLLIQAKMLAARIRDWNYTEEDGSKSVIDMDSVCRLFPEDFSFLVEKLNGGLVEEDAEQKKSLPSS